MRIVGIESDTFEYHRSAIRIQECQVPWQNDVEWNPSGLKGNRCFDNISMLPPPTIILVLTVDTSPNSLQAYFSHRYTPSHL